MDTNDHTICTLGMSAFGVTGLDYRIPPSFLSSFKKGLWRKLQCTLEEAVLPSCSLVQGGWISADIYTAGQDGVMLRMGVT